MSRTPDKRQVALAAASILIITSPLTFAADASVTAVGSSTHDPTNHGSGVSSADEKAAGHLGEDSAQATISTVQYSVPPVKLIREDGRRVSLPEEMNDGRPVVLNFVFTTCGSICPLMSQVFGQFQRKLGEESGHVHLMSISTDPEEDSPGRLREYARQFGAQQGWNHYTGTLEASQSVQRAFGTYRGDKMSHTPVTLIRVAPGRPWLRIDGFVTPDELLLHYHELLATR